MAKNPDFFIKSDDQCIVHQLKQKKLLRCDLADIPDIAEGIFFDFQLSRRFSEAVSTHLLNLNVTQIYLSVKIQGLYFFFLILVCNCTN